MEASNKYSGKKMVAVREVVNFTSHSGEEEPVLEKLFEGEAAFSSRAVREHFALQSPPQA